MLICFLLNVKKLIRIECCGLRVNQLEEKLFNIVDFDKMNHKGFLFVCFTLWLQLLKFLMNEKLVLYASNAFLTSFNLFVHLNLPLNLILSSITLFIIHNHCPEWEMIKTSSDNIAHHSPKPTDHALRRYRLCMQLPRKVFTINSMWRLLGVHLNVLNEQREIFSAQLTPLNCTIKLPLQADVMQMKLFFILF